MKIADILKQQQPDIYKKLNTEPREKRKKKRRGSYTEHLSFRDFDRMMREKADIDETKCRGR